MNAAPRRVLLVDDHPLMRQSITEGMSRTSDLTVCGEAANVTEAVYLLESTRPDVVVTDLSMPDQNGFHFLDFACGKYPAIPVLVLSMHNELIHAPRAFRAGAAGYVMKGAGIGQLLAATRQLLAGGIHLSDRVRANILQQLRVVSTSESQAPFETLTEAEHRTLEALGQRGSEAQPTTLTKSADIETARCQTEIRRKLRLMNDVALLHYAILCHEAQQVHP